MSLERRIAELATNSGRPEASDAAAERFLARALDEGPVDIAYDVLDSPLGPLMAAATPAGLVKLSYLANSSEERELERLAERLSPRVLRGSGRVEPVRRQLGEYFEGRRRDFELETDWSLIGPFARKVLERTAAIPYGSLSTYGEVAAAAGSPRGARAAGNALGSNPIPIVIPCHRVLRVGGALGGYGGGVDRKERLLRLERETEGLR